MPSYVTELDESGLRMILKYILWKSVIEKLFLSGFDVEDVHPEQEKRTLDLSLSQLKHCLSLARSTSIMWLLIPFTE